MTPTLSVEPVHRTVIEVALAPVALTAVGSVGAVTSAVRPLPAALGADTLPAASTARTV